MTIRFGTVDWGLGPLSERVQGFRVKVQRSAGIGYPGILVWNR